MIPRRDTGGMVDPSSPTIGGVAPSVATMNPNMRALIQRYSSLPTEKLQELAFTMGGSPQGQIAQQVLRQKQITGATTPAQSVAPVQMQQPVQSAPSVATVPQPQRRGGVTRRDMGGNIPLSQADPWWTRREANGFLSGSTGGREDAIQTHAEPDSFVIPADVVSGAGEGNSLSGARRIQIALETGPYGTQQPPQRRGMGIPRAPAPYRDNSMNNDLAQITRQLGAAKPSETPDLSAESKGGGLRHSAAGKSMPVALSHGEMVVPRRLVLLWGNGHAKSGHKILRQFVLEQRKKNIEDLKKLPPPAK